MAYLGTGTTISCAGEDESTTTVDIFAEIVSIKLPSLEAGKVDVSHMASVGYREYLTKELLDVGEMEVELNFDPTIDPTNYVGSGKTFVITFDQTTPATTWTFTGGLAKYDATIPLEDKMSVTASFTVEDGFSIT